MLSSAKPNTPTPGTFKLSRLNGWPMCSPTDASPASSRMPTHGSGPMGIATPSLQWTFTTYSLPVSTGAPVCLTCAQSLVPIEVMISDLAIKAFQASQHASRRDWVHRYNADGLTGLLGRLV